MPYGVRRPVTLYNRGVTGPVVGPPNNRSFVAAFQNPKVLAFAVLTAMYTAFLYRSGGAGSYLGVRPNPQVAAAAKSALEARRNKNQPLQVTTWNIAAINNNPFEYWMTIDDRPQYQKLMIDVENFLDNPGDEDVPVSQVFTQEMFDALDKRLTETAKWDSVKKFWDDDFKNRKIVSKFMKDGALGKKRLASMPDRVTNTISLVDSDQPACRPTIINMYDGDLPNMEEWWKAWEAFMFDKELNIRGKQGPETKIPYQMLQPILKAKYKDITEEEEKVSLPLQTLCGAIFDAILVHMMNKVSKPEEWQPLKQEIVESLVHKKVPQTLRILKEKYGDSDIITLQEVSAALVEQAKSEMGDNYLIVAPDDINPSRDQNSVILLRKATFPSVGREITSTVMDSLLKISDVDPKTGEKKPPADKGDILAVVASDLHNVPYVIVSFHGDTNGRATKPVLKAVMNTLAEDSELVSYNLIFGLDANTYEVGSKDYQGVMDFGDEYAAHQLSSCWGDQPQPTNYTTYNARTFLQPQLNKACKSTEKRECGDVNPKDHILFPKVNWQVLRTWKDNTGEGTYKEDMPFPTLDFPSDHGILTTVLEAKKT